ncbi:MAG: hypothetical protein NC907_06305, partial [Candidatus Omnitrophica bacterium]|nr:hypothetical protein [Candidatus Omnitrophota bacterium]
MNAKLKSTLEEIKKIRGKDVKKELRNAIRDNLSIPILERLKEEDKNWRGIDEVINKLKDEKLHQESGFDVKELKYSDIEIKTVHVPSFSETEKKEVIDYFGFAIYPEPKHYLPCGVCINLKKEFLIGILGAYEGSKGKYKELNEESEKRKFLKRLSLQELETKEDPIDEIVNILNEKMKKVMEDKEKGFKELKELVDIFYKTDKTSSPYSIPSILNALHTKPFLILAGISGTGKTQIARLIASAMSTQNGDIKIDELVEKLSKYINEKLILMENYEAGIQKSEKVAFLPVRPDWNEPKKMWGYYNPLTGLFYPTDGLITLLNAYRNFVTGEKQSRYFIILDEMNLARVEYYMSDLLSLMENMWSKKEGKIKVGETAM